MVGKIAIFGMGPLSKKVHCAVEASINLLLLTGVLLTVGDVDVQLNWVLYFFLPSEPSRVTLHR